MGLALTGGYCQDHVWNSNISHSGTFQTYYSGHPNIYCRTSITLSSVIKSRTSDLFLTLISRTPLSLQLSLYLYFILSLHILSNQFHMLCYSYLLSSYCVSLFGYPSIYL